MDDSDFNIESLRLPADFEPPPKPVGAAKPRQASKAEDRLIGCPLWWLQCVRPAVKTRDQLIVAIYLWRRRIVCKSATFDVPNGELKALGVSRKIKSRTLDLLAAAGLIEFAQRAAKAAPTITILTRRDDNAE
jgi:hypothetical protein